MATDREMIDKLDQLVKKIEIFQDGLEPLLKSLKYHIGQQHRQPSGGEKRDR